MKELIAKRGTTIGRKSIAIAKNFFEQDAKSFAWKFTSLFVATQVSHAHFLNPLCTTATWMTLS